MTTVKVLVDHVGEWMAGDIVIDAPAGLVHIARVGTINIATGQLVAELVEEQKSDSEEIKDLRDKAKDLKISKYLKMNEEELVAAINDVGGGLDGE